MDTRPLSELLRPGYTHFGSTDTKDRIQSCSCPVGSHTSLAAWSSKACVANTDSFDNNVFMVHLTTMSAAQTIHCKWHKISSKGLLLTLWSWALLERPPVVQPLRSFLAFYGTRKFITESTRALQLHLSRARPVHSEALHPISKRCILMFSTHLRLCLPSGLF
jgi:hypothetical protein